MITEKVLRNRRRKFEFQIENHMFVVAGPGTPEALQRDAKVLEASASIIKIDKALELFDGAKKPQYPPLLLGTDPTVLVAPIKGKGKQRKYKKKIVEKDEVAFALEK